MHDVYYNSRIYVYINIIFFSILFSSNHATAQNETENFTYSEPCGCTGEVDLVIYNGLSGDFGGQEIPSTKEDIRGAITVANMNDTDGDGIKDFEDDIVVESEIGRSEVDLMRLDIRITDVVTPSCEFVQFNLSSGLRLWEQSTKVTPIDNRRVPVSSLPMTIYVEATEPSFSIADMEIIAGLLGENGELIKTDKVVITSIWFENRENHLDVTVLPTPSSLGIDGVNLLNVINNEFVSTDGRRYGKGTLRPMDFILSSSGPPSKIDAFLGGRILMPFEILPTDLALRLNEYGVKIDITRRKNVNVTGYNDFGRDASRIVTWPIKLEESNDDDNDATANDSYDEDTDLSNNTTLAFSFDAPSERRIASRIVDIPNGINEAAVIARSNKQFEEFVRLSFKLDPVGNSLQGSRASDKLLWEMTFDAAMESSIHPTDPYFFEFSEWQVVGSTGIRHTIPRCFARGKGNGAIDITPIGITNDVVDSYDLQYVEESVSDPDNPGDMIIISRWILYKVQANDNLDPVVASDYSINGPWSLSSPLVSIEITNGGTRFSPTDFVFSIYKKENILENRIRLTPE
jgi:hypothetical protein